MAFSNIALMRKNLVDDRLVDLDGAIFSGRNSVGAAKAKAEQDMKSQIEFLEMKEKAFFDNFEDLNGTTEEKIEQLNSRIKQIKDNTTIGNLSGEKLNQILLLSLQDIVNEKVSNIRNEFIQNFKKYENQLDEKDKKKIRTNIINFINIGTNRTGSSKVWSTSRMNFDSLANFSYSALTRTQKKAIEEINAKSKDAQWVKKIFGEPSVKEGEINQTSDGASSVVTFNAFQEIVSKGLTKKIGEKLDPDEVNKINKAVTEQIIQMAPQCGLKPLINYMLRQDPYCFFCGKNIQKITGVLGELQGLFILRALITGKNTGSVPKGVKWTANTKDIKGKDLHSDILIGKMGVQSKSTKKDIKTTGLEDVSFTTLTFNHFIERISENGDYLSQTIIDAIQNLYGIDTFNIEVHPDFHGTRLKIEEMVESLDPLFSAYAQTLMYMNGKDIKVGDGNGIYLIAGTTLIAASTILKDIHQKLKEKTKTGLKVRTIKPDKGWITYKEAIKYKKEGFEGEKWHLPDVSQQVVLQSSFTFSPYLTNLKNS